MKPKLVVNYVTVISQDPMLSILEVNGQRVPVSHNGNGGVFVVVSHKYNMSNPVKIEAPSIWKLARVLAETEPLLAKYEG